MPRWQRVGYGTYFQCGGESHREFEPVPQTLTLTFESETPEWAFELGTTASRIRCWMTSWCVICTGLYQWLDDRWHGWTLNVERWALTEEKSLDSNLWNLNSRFRPASSQTFRVNVLVLLRLIRTRNSSNIALFLRLWRGRFTVTKTPMTFKYQTKPHKPWRCPRTCPHFFNG